MYPYHGSNSPPANVNALHEQLSHPREGKYSTLK